LLSVTPGQNEGKSIQSAENEQRTVTVHTMGRGAKVKERGSAIKNHHQLQSFVFAWIRGDKAVEGALDFGAHVFRHAVMVEHAVEVVILMLEDASLKTIQGHFEFFPLQVLSLDLDTNRTLWIEK
jgi:hypothetical protein